MAKTLRANLDSVIDRVIAEQRIVGAAVLVSHDGKIVYEKCAGLNDREAGVAMRAGDIFRLSSLSKPIVAATALATIERGKLRIDDPLHAGFPSSARRCPMVPHRRLQYGSSSTIRLGSATPFLKTRKGHTIWQMCPMASINRDCRLRKIFKGYRQFPCHTNPAVPGGTPSQAMCWEK